MGRPLNRMTLGICGNALAYRNGKWFTHHTFGRIVERIAARVGRVEYRGLRLKDTRADTADFELQADNITVQSLGNWQNSLQALRQPHHLAWRFAKLAAKCDAVFLRGTMPLIWTTHLIAAARRIPVVHWFGANPAAVVGAERRGYGQLLEFLGRHYAGFERMATLLAIRANRSHIIANGREISDLYRTAQTTEVVSTSITKDDIFAREDTCRDETVRLLFVGFIRAEKGIEYLIRALPLIKTQRPLHLALVGSWDQFPTEYNRLRALITELRLEEQVSWEGYAAFGRDLFQQMDRSDVFIAPSLSEGTPRVLVEARARSLPLVSTLVGGIPSSVSNGWDGILVPPRDVNAIAQAVSRIINEPDLRRRLIRNGRERVSKLTLEWFVDLVLNGIEERS